MSVIMAGGSGTRFWPLSRSALPKQYLPLAGNGSTLIQGTAERLRPLNDAGELLVVTARSQLPLVHEQLPDAATLGEPVPRNTAPCIGIAALVVEEELGDIPMLCLPADHLIHGQDALTRVFRAGIERARSNDVLVTFGITPSYPETGYGYIRARRDRAVQADSGVQLSPVEAFVEKPSREVAEGYLLSGEYCWNSGMFAWRPSVILREIRSHLPELAAGLEEIRKLIRRKYVSEEFDKLFSQLPSVSIDYGVMEKASSVEVCWGEGFLWSDVGSWSSWYDAEQRQNGLSESQNVSSGDSVLLDSSGSAIISTRRFVAGIGLSDILVVETDDAVLVCHRAKAQEVRRIVEYLKEQGRKELL